MSYSGMLAHYIGMFNFPDFKDAFLAFNKEVQSNNSRSMTKIKEKMQSFADIVDLQECNQLPILRDTAVLKGAVVVKIPIPSQASGEQPMPEIETATPPVVEVATPNRATIVGTTAFELPKGRQSEDEGVDGTPAMATPIDFDTDGNLVDI